MTGLSASGLADLAGATVAEVQRLMELGILAARDGTDPFLETDVPKVRLATACEQAGLPMAGVAAAIRSGRLSFAFLEAALYRRWPVRTGPRLSGAATSRRPKRAGAPCTTVVSCASMACTSGSKEKLDSTSAAALPEATAASRQPSPNAWEDGTTRAAASI